MVKSDVDGIEIASNGILINVRQDSSYASMRLKVIDELRQKERINNMEQDIISMKDLLSTILAKVS